MTDEEDKGIIIKFLFVPDILGIIYGIDNHSIPALIYFGILFVLLVILFYQNRKRQIKL